MGVMTFAAGPTMVTLMDDDRICQHIKAGHGYEPETLATWAYLMKPGQWAIDIGAYSGLFSLIAAKRGARAVAVEPLPIMQKRIRDNFDLNSSVKEVYCRLYAAAATDKPGKVRIGVNDKVHLTSGASVLRKSNSMEVDAWTLDSFTERPICAIKIDVERYEMTVLEGGMQLLKDARPPALIVECLDQDTVVAVSDKLKRLYNPKRILDKRNMLLEAI